MFLVRNIPIFVDEIQVLQELKKQVFEQTGKSIFYKMKKSGDNIMVCCPIHKNGQERRPSCGIATKPIADKPPGTVHCFACGYTNSLEGLISELFGHKGSSFGSEWLYTNFIQGEEYERPIVPLDIKRTSIIGKVKKQQFITEEELSKYRFYHPYMFQRKLTKEVIEKYDVGYQKDYIHSDKDEQGNIMQWKPTEVLTFPVKDKNGNVLFVSRRAIYNKTFFLPKNVKKPVYGIYELPNPCNQLIVCESVINALTCVGYGVPAVALFGTGDENQYNQLRSLPVRHFILGLDPDRAGKLGVKKLKYALKDRLVTVLQLPEGKDINDLTREEFMTLRDEY